MSHFSRFSISTSFLITAFLAMFVFPDGPASAAPPKPVAVLEGHGGGVHRVAFSSDGKALASVSRGSLRVWDVATGKEQLVF
jgi:WD40 repeat protein